MASGAIAGILALAGAHSAAFATPSYQAQEPSAPTAAPSATIEPTLTEIIAMQVERYRRMTVPVTIMGEGPFNFLVDTGAQTTLLSRGLADQLQLNDRDTATLVGMASMRIVETTTVPDFALGDRQFTIRTAPLVEDADFFGDADGILGLDTLQDQRVLLDFGAGEMSVSESLPRGGSSGYDIVVRARERLGQLIIHRAVLDGIDIDVVIDTGAQVSIGNIALQRRLNRRRMLGDSVLTDVNGEELVSETRVARHLELDNVRLTNIAICFADSPAFDTLRLTNRPAMILGMSELRLFDRVAIDFRSRRVLFDLPDDVAISRAF